MRLRLRSARHEMKGSISGGREGVVSEGQQKQRAFMEVSLRPYTIPGQETIWAHSYHMIQGHMIRQEIRRGEADARDLHVT